MAARWSRGVRALACLVVVASVVVGGAQATADPAQRHAVRFTPGAPGVGDPYFPLEGNGGYDVGHYLLDLAYLPSAHRLRGTVHIYARATQNLSRFDLDLSGMTVQGVHVDGRRATFDRNGPELRVTPRTGLRRGHRFDVAVAYHGSPRTITGSPIVFGADYGWQYTRDGAFVGDEPNAARTWFPCNDHPSDKATFTVHMAVPRGTQVASNGDLVSHRRSATGRATTFLWRETSPMATYLSTVDIGRFAFTRGRTPGGIRETTAIDPTLARAARRGRVIPLTGAITDYWAKKFGPYPFTSTGAIVDNVPNVGFSLETQTRPLYGFAPDEFTMSHELSHEWFGDSVSVRTWRDIWLNEGFATFASWLWIEHTGGPDTYRFAGFVVHDRGPKDRFWKQSIADPKRNTMFSDAVYERGGATLAALRHLIGDRDFFALLQRWAAAHRHANATTSQFVHLAERVSGRDLTRFFHIWLWAKRKPASLSAH